MRPERSGETGGALDIRFAAGRTSLVSTGSNPVPSHRCSCSFFGEQEHQASLAYDRAACLQSRRVVVQVHRGVLVSEGVSTVRL